MFLVLAPSAQLDSDMKNCVLCLLISNTHLSTIYLFIRVELLCIRQSKMLVVNKANVVSEWCWTEGGKGYTLRISITTELVKLDQSLSWLKHSIEA